MGRVRKGKSAARVFMGRPDRIAAAWRRLRRGALWVNGSLNLLEGVVEPLTREVGRALKGELGSPWSRTRGLLRISRARGVRALHDEFGTLRRCMMDALDALDASERERRIVEGVLDEALDSAVELCLRLSGEVEEPSSAPFGGLVLELFEGAPAQPRADLSRAAAH